MKTTALLLFGIIISLNVRGQVSNWDTKLNFGHICNYDFEVNQQTGPTLTGLNVFMIVTNQQGTGKIVFLADVHNVHMNTQKNTYIIDRSSYNEYSGGGVYAIFYCHNEYGDSEIVVDFKKRGRKQRVKSLSVRNRGTGILLF